MFRSSFASLDIFHLLWAKSHVIHTCPTCLLLSRAWPVAALLRPPEILLTREMAGWAFSCLWTYFWTKPRQVVLRDCQVSVTWWVSYILEVSASQWDFAEFDMLIFTEEKSWHKQKEMWEKKQDKVFKRLSSGIFLLWPSMLFLHTYVPQKELRGNREAAVMAVTSRDCTYSEELKRGWLGLVLF